MPYPNLATGPHRKTTYQINKSFRGSGTRINFKPLWEVNIIHEDASLKVLVVGNGAREHAIARKLSQDDVIIYSAMARRNPGIAQLSNRAVIMDINDLDSYDRFSDVDIAYIGPEVALAAGVVDKLEEIGIPSVGPSKAAAKLEWSKAFARTFFEENGITGNPDFRICHKLDDVREFMKKTPELVVKPDVLTGGKGVRLTGEQLHSAKDVEKYALERIQSDGLVVLEEKLKGKEFTLQGFSDGKNVRVMPIVRDFKRAYDGDKGPNTGSMGSYSCPDHGLPDLSSNAVSEGTEIMKQTVRKMNESGLPFKGILYGGFMETRAGVYLIEYNVRFGDPEAINVLSLLDGSLLKTGWSIINGKLSEVNFQKMATVCVYLVPKGYPISPKKDSHVELVNTIGSEVYYASVHEENGIIKTTGSRSIALLAKGTSVSEAREKVYSDVPKVKGDLFHRSDIGLGVE